jgi:uncharacterized protein with NRDE domain
MCLAVIAWQAHPEYPLIVASNRDEFYSRRTRPAAWWGQRVSLLGGRDEEGGGTWLAINRRGRFALLTNVRAPAERNPRAPSRGQLVVSALQATGPLPQWFGPLAPRASAYNGFNLLVGEARPAGGHLVFYSNRHGGEPQTLAPGIYGLSNATLDTPWPKVTRSVARFAWSIARRVDSDELLELLADRTLAHDRELPVTGVPLEWERVLSAVRIRANGYGTRASTVLIVRRDGLASLVERSYHVVEGDDRHTDRCFEFTIDTAAALGSKAI